MNKRKLGTSKEIFAAEYLTAQGIVILEMNYRCKYGEIDIIGKHKNYYVFLEVKYRDSDRSGFPEEAVTYKKQCTICKVADYYRMRHNISESMSWRYDVIAVYKDNTVRWHQNAFMHVRW